VPISAADFFTISTRSAAASGVCDLPVAVDVGDEVVHGARFVQHPAHQVHAKNGDDRATVGTAL
jgi:hypothetical protein